MEERVCLVVDDDPAIRGYLQAILQRHGWQCLEAGNAPDAQRIIVSLRGAVDLILTDVEMPGSMNGIGLAEWVRESFPAIPVVLVSGSGDPTPAGFPLVSKPCKPETVMRAIDFSLRRAS